jgi:hypothetical protein
MCYLLDFLSFFLSFFLSSFLFPLFFKRIMNHLYAVFSRVGLKLLSLNKKFLLRVYILLYFIWVAIYNS